MSGDRPPVPLEMSRFPAFYIVGAAKAGTTSLWNYLRPHPDVFLGSIKEPNFFAFGPEGPNVTGPAPPETLRSRLHGDTVTDEARYLDLFGAAGDRTTGEASVRYLYKPDAAGRIAAARPDARIIIMLRDPVERLRSHYSMNRSHDLEPLSPADAIEAEDRRVEAGWGWDWHYVRVGLYAEQVERYLRAFDRDQVLVLGHDEFSQDPVGAVKTVCAHIGVDTDFVADTDVKAKQAYIPRSRWVEAIRKPGGPVDAVSKRLPIGLRRRAGAALRRVNHQPVEQFDDDLRRQLGRRFQADRDRLEQLVGQPIL